MKIKDIIYEFFKVGRNFDQSKGIHPLKIFFSSVGGMVGIGNVVGIITAVQIGCPGSLFWVWLAAPLGALIKYSEIFLGMKYRITKNNTFEGGPMSAIMGESTFIEKNNFFKKNIITFV